MGQRLVAEGCSHYQVGPGPSWGGADKASYAAWQQKLGFSGGDADGIPGQTSWDRLQVPSPNGDNGSRASSPVPDHGITTGYHVPGSHWSLGYHTGADYAADEGTPCVAVLNGSISRADDDPSFGHYLVLRVDGSDFWYCHLSERLVGAGAGVGAGQEIGRVGQTGNATGPHLHFEKRPAGGGFGSDVSPDW
ncbi:murein DD-endopeptidase MepM/ murein hydrolase activator NlpD [Kitasatospora paracochleata]|uniref:Murein DD-endopeptidase MepM/ murein hydrolase activator NlpD n=1 Tax=Kitasatospora paracochleata TaxID=58354 RepID=A0ABT1J158_9ACTN|nr:murein DD-endopeptidase MepM/ murein hydrolase activator NlpD [Kitasatospora paracochleata]